MTFRFQPLTATVFALALFAVPAFSQTGSIQGVVKNKDGKPIDGAVVTLDRVEGGKSHLEMKSDKKGEYRGMVPVGKYDITLMVGGQKGGSITGAVITSGSNPPIDFDLSASQAAAGSSDSGDKGGKAREAELAKNKALNEAYNAGKAAIDAKNWDEAITQLNKAAELGPTQAAVWSSLADAYAGSAKTMKGAEAEAQYQKSFDAYKKLIELKPMEAGNFNNYALALAADKKLDEARTNLAKAIELDPPGAGKYHYNLGALLMNGNQADGALDEFRKAIDADPNYAEAYFYLGSTLVGKATLDPSGKMVAPPGTLDALQKYLALKPDGPNAQAAKDLIGALGASVQTNYKDPNAPAPKGKKK